MTPFPPKKILVPFDFSGRSAAAWRHAVALARRFEAKLEVLHVQEWPPAAELAPLAPRRLSVGARRALIARIRETVGMGSRILLASGDPGERILSLARARRADLIVMGTR